MTRSAFFPLELIIFLVCFFLSTFLPRVLRFIFVFPVVAIYAYYVTQIPRETAKTSDYAAGLLGMMFVMKSVEFFIASDPPKEDWIVEKPKKEKTETNGTNGHVVNGTKGVLLVRPRMYSDLSLIEKFKWIAGNAFSSRGIGWNWQIKYLPNGVRTGTLKFPYILRTVRHIIWIYFLQDIGRTYLAHVPYYQSDGREGTAAKDLTGYKRLEMVWMLGLRTFVETDIPYLILCIIGVTTGLFWSVPEDNRPVFGVWSETWTIRRFWGRTWHQHIRRPMQIIGIWFARDILHAPKGSLLSRYTQVYMSFFLSGLIHVVGANTLDSNKTYYWTWKFFLFQGNGIVVEDLAIYLGEKAGIKESRTIHLLGLAWVFAWFTWTSPWFFDDCAELGVLRPEMFPISVIRGVWKGQWETSMI